MADVSSCYLFPSCVNVQVFYDPKTGFTNDTGFLSPNSAACCQICLPGTPPTVCFNSSAFSNCASKTGNADYDYLLLDQIWLAQFCHALSSNLDPTLSHVQHSACLPTARDLARLSIHGLWPNYLDGYPQCCNSTGALEALDPSEVASWDIFSQLQTDWQDPTSSAGSGLI